MKKQIIVAVTLLCSVFGFSQQQGTITKLEDSGLRLSEMYTHKKLITTQGSPYLMQAFTLAKVANISSSAMMRYNAANDQFEFINSAGDTLSLNKSQPFDDITFTIQKVNYRLVDYKEKSGKVTNGYLVKLMEKNGFVLYKRQKIIYRDAQPAKSSYDTATPAKFTPAEDTFFLQKGDGEILELPNSKKGFLKLYPDKKTELEAYIKQNNIDPEKEQGVIKLVDFLAQ